MKEKDEEKNEDEDEDMEKEEVGEEESEEDEKEKKKEKVHLSPSAYQNDCFHCCWAEILCICIFMIFYSSDKFLPWT